MTDTSPRAWTSERNVLQFTLRSERPLGAIELGKLLTTLAREYKRTSRGRTLVVTSLRPGSTIVELMDLAAVVAPALGDAANLAKAAGSLADFTKFIFGSLQRKKQAAPPTPDPLPGDASADAVIEAASKINGEIEVLEKKTIVKVAPALGGELERMTEYIDVREIRVTSVEAISIREREKTQRARIRAAQAPIEGPHAQKLLGGLEPSEVADTIRGLSSTGASQMDVKAAIESFVSALQLLSLTHLVETLAVDFDVAGEPQLAALLRSARETGGEQKAKG